MEELKKKIKETHHPNLPIIYELDIYGNIIYVSSSIKMILGYESEYFLKKEIIWQDLVHPEDFKRFNQNFKFLVQKKKEFFFAKYRIKDKAGNYRNVKESAFIKDSLSSTPIIIGTVQEIPFQSELNYRFKVYEGLFNYLMNYSLDAIFLCARTSEVVKANVSAAEMFGVESPSEFINSKPVEFSPEYQKNGIKSEELSIEYIEKAIKRGFYQFEWSSMKKSGELFDTFITIVPIKPNFLNIEVLILIRDVTYLKQTERKALLTYKHQALELLAGGFAHDYNNILSIMQGNLDLMNFSDSNNKEINKNIQQIQQGIIKAKNLTNRLFYFSKYGAPLKTADCIDDVLLETAKFIKVGCAVTIVVEIEEDLGKFKFDKIQISQVLQNLLLNSIQATKSSGKIKLIAQKCIISNNEIADLEAGKYVKISVIDNGSGIPPEILPKIFDPYFSTKSDGNGLGLSICQSIIKSHKGTLTVNSKVGEYTEFTFYLPLNK